MREDGDEPLEHEVEDSSDSEDSRSDADSDSDADIANGGSERISTKKKG